MTTANCIPPLNQIALSVVDLRSTEAWFVEGLGFLPAGGSMFMMSGPIAAPIMGIPGAASCAWWLIGRNAWFQLEMFQFRQPISKLMPADFRPCDVGYTRLGVHVNDFDAALASLARLGSEPLSTPGGAPGHRRACVRSPDGVYVEIMEDDPLPQPEGSEREGSPVAVRSVTLSTSNLEASVAYLTAVNGKGPEEIALHTPEHEALWGLPGASYKRAIFRSGDILVEVVQYLDPVGKPWPRGYRICDQGILNISYGQRSQADHTLVYKRAAAFGARSNRKPFHFNNAGVVYMNDQLGFSVELSWLKKGRNDVKYGFEPILPRDARPQHNKLRISGSVQIAAPVQKLWEILNDQDSMSEWIGFNSVHRIRDGSASRNGVGSERLMFGKPGRVVEQITAVEPGRSIRYRVTEGGPIRYHNGEIVLRPAGDGCVVDWSIRCRSKYPFVGGLLRRALQKMLDQMLRQGLKPYAERVATVP
jgi:uncharacterized protein YndB with AHSA1/START domain/catechol 2,3-dioxygenase-like lactoylglutathione lyase family enzyme